MPTQIKINGRTYYFDHLTNFTRVSRSEYTVQRNTTTYTIYGGKHAGGRSNEWFVESAEWAKPIYTSSLVDSLNLVERM